MELLKNQTAIVTGGNAGIGKAVALRFAQQGARVAIFGTNVQRGNQAVEEIRQATKPIMTKLRSAASTDPTPSLTEPTSQVAFCQSPDGVTAPTTGMIRPSTTLFTRPLSAARAATVVPLCRAMRVSVSPATTTWPVPAPAPGAPRPGMDSVWPACSAGDELAAAWRGRSTGCFALTSSR